MEAAGTVGVWSRIARFSFHSHPPLFDFVLPAHQRGSSHREEEEGSGEGEGELQLLSSLPSLPAVFLWLFVMPPLLPLLPEATAPWCRQILRVGYAYDVLIIRFAIT